ncbi:MAG: TetR/AcrR family transcriptional regulator [Aquisalinus sp.]|nr:TetR/AcrR family transcriptional regulator [Aquisalinus sp.]
MPDASFPSQTDMRRRILDAAAVLLAENGYKATTLRNVAEAAGLKAGSIYYHFPSKDHITVEVLNEGVQQVSKAVGDAVNLAEGESGRAILRAAVNAHLKALAEHSSYTRASIRCFSMVPEEIRHQTVDVRRAFDAQWLSILQKIQSTGAIREDVTLKHLHLIILGTLNWTLEWQSADEQERQQLADTLSKLILN